MYEDPLKIPSVKGPPGAPIGWNVHALGSAAAPPYAEKQEYRAKEPEKGVQHQPVILPADFYGPPKPAPELSPEMEYRRSVGEEGVRFSNANLDKLVAAGMTSDPKVRFNNSILADPTGISKDSIYY